MREAVGRWEIMLEECLKYDRWGQVVEAQETYRKWVEDVGVVLREGKTDLPGDQYRQVRCLQATLRDRITNIQYHGQSVLQDSHRSSRGREPGINCEELAKIQERFRGHFLENVPWPIQIDAHTIEDGGDDDDSQGDAFSDHRGTLQGPPREKGTYLKLTIDSIGLKDATTYLDPFITVSVRSGPSDKHLWGLEQNTPQPKAKAEGQHIPFGGVPVFIQTPLDELVRQKANIFLEFKHWKPKKQKVSVRCWSMLGWDELEKAENCTKELEIYAKPADFSARTFHKHSVKPLYLTIGVTMLSNG